MPPSEVEQTALRCVPGSGPIVLDHLASGPVNESYRATRNGRPYALRVAAPRAALSPDRVWECRVLECAAAAGVAPRIVCCEPLQGILVAHWAEGRAWTLEQAREPENISKVALLMRRVHALPPPPAPRIMGPARWISYYQDALRGSGAGPLPIVRWHLELNAALEEHLAALDALPVGESVLVHSDLHVQNLIEGERGLVLLDWEYSHMAQPFWDLAGWACNNDLRVESRRFLLASYLGRQPTGEDAARLGHLAWLYDYVCMLWSALYSNSSPGGPREAILARAEVLAGRLRHEPSGRAG